MNLLIIFCKCYVPKGFYWGINISPFWRKWYYKAADHNTGLNTNIGVYTFTRSGQCDNSTDKRAHSTKVLTFQKFFLSYFLVIHYPNNFPPIIQYTITITNIMISSKINSTVNHLKPYYTKNKYCILILLSKKEKKKN